MHFLSVIIPVYKVEKYLRQCVDSVIAQQLPDIEIILVDDGSPDNCPAICDEYAVAYEFIRVIHKKNGGLSSARNAGISAATGEYIVFMDSDDWWNEKVSVSEMLEAVQKNPEVEMFLFTSLDYVEGSGFYKRAEHERLDSIRTDTVVHYYEDLLSNGNLEVHGATKIFKSVFLKENDLPFKNGIVSEDSEWIMRVLRVLKSVRILNYPLYIYRAGRQGSIVNTIGVKNIKDLLSIVESSIEFYKASSGNNKIKELEFCYCAYLWFCALGLSASLDSSAFRKLIPLLKKTSEVCEYSNSRKTLLAYRVYKLVGLVLTRNILGLYLNFKHRVNLNKTKQ